MKIAIAAVAKNEELYIQEWIDAYKKLGVNHFFIFDNNDIGNNSLAKVLYSNSDLNLIDVRGQEAFKSIGYQFGAYKYVYDNFKNDYDYIGFFDIDEFLHLYGMSIPEWLDKHKILQNANVIKFNWIMYGDNNLVYYDDRPVQERFLIANPPEQCNIKNFPDTYHTKCLVKCEKELINGGPHNFILKDGISTNTIGNIIPSESPFSIPPTFKNGYIKHYSTKTIQEYLFKKCKNLIDATGGYISLDDRLKSFFVTNIYTEEKQKCIDAFLKDPQNYNI